MKRKIALSAMLACLLVIGLALAGCDNGSTSGNNPDAPVITKLVVGIRLSDSDAGKPEKTVFNKDDQFIYGFRAIDSKGDWKKMVHTIKFGDQTYDASWDFPNDFIGSVNIGNNAGGIDLAVQGLGN